MIRSVVASIDALPVLDKPKIVTVEGSDATIEAFRRLTTTFYGLLSFKLPPSSDELRELQKRAITQAEATAGGRPQITEADVVGQGGLSSATTSRSPSPFSSTSACSWCRWASPRAGWPASCRKCARPSAAPSSPSCPASTKFDRDRQIRENFEIFRHVVFDFNGEYYAAIPLIAPYSVDRRRPNAYSPADVEALQQEAHLLANFFTSFEREKLFNRVMMPLISTARIQKKLWAQGSKFAHAEAFRLYKFKDGAWQDMILGAIMGAAKRVEAEKRTRRTEADAFGRTLPGLDRHSLDSDGDIPTTTRRRQPMSSRAAMAAATGRPEPERSGLPIRSARRSPSRRFARPGTSPPSSAPRGSRPPPHRALT